MKFTIRAGFVNGTAVCSRQDLLSRPHKSKEKLSGLSARKNSGEHKSSVWDPIFL